MKKVILLRSNQIVGDSRVEKYLTFFKENGIDYHVYGWDRDGYGAKSDKTTFFTKKVGYMVGGIKAAFYRLYWFAFIIKSLLREETKPRFIHACDLDTAYPAALYKAIFNRKCYLLFDAFDWVSADEAVNKSPIIKIPVALMEKYALKHSNKLLICEEERKSQIPDCDKYDYDVLPNIPMIREQDTNIFSVDEDFKFDNEKITFSYVGYFGDNRFLEELLKLAEENVINLLMAGAGNKKLEEKCHELESRNNFKYFGRVPYSLSLNIMYNSDIIYAMYCKVVNNHYYAAPNKFYEPMALGKALLTTKGIIIGDKVEKLGFGYTTNENYNELLELVKSLKIDDVRKKGEIARELWNSTYSDYTRDFLENKYMDWMVQN